MVRSELYFGLPFHYASMWLFRMAGWNNATSATSYPPYVLYYFSWSSFLLSPPHPPRFKPNRFLFRSGRISLGILFWMWYFSCFDTVIGSLQCWNSQLARVHSNAVWVATGLDSGGSMQVRHGWVNEFVSVCAFGASEWNVEQGPLFPQTEQIMLNVWNKFC